MQLVLATTNGGKLREIRELLDGLSVEISTLKDYPGLEPPEESGTTFAENARIKALYYAARSGAMTVADDSGLVVDALGGAPGVHSARWGGSECSYPQKFRLLYDALDRAGDPARTARFQCSLAVAHGTRILFEASGTVEGQIASEPRGDGGFGYDPIFFYPPWGCTLAEAGARKSSISHRGRAFGLLRAFLERKFHDVRRPEWPGPTST